MNKLLYLILVLCASLSASSCSEISDGAFESKLKGDWVAYKVISYLDGDVRDTNYNGLVYSLSFKNNSTVEVVYGTYDTQDGWELDGPFGVTDIANYYIENRLLRVSGWGFWEDNVFEYKRGELVLTEQEYERGTGALEETVVYYKKSK